MQTTEQGAPMVESCGQHYLSQYVRTLKQLHFRVQFFFGNLGADGCRIVAGAHHWVHARAFDQELGGSLVVGWLKHGCQDCTRQHGAESYDDCALVTKSNGDQISRGERRRKAMSAV